MKFDENLKSKFLDLLSQGVPIKMACEAVGITTNTYYHHRIKDEWFRKSIAEVRARAVSTKLAKLNEMAEKTNSWQALSWQLRVMFPEEFGEVKRLDVQATVKHKDMDQMKLAQAWGAELGIDHTKLLRDTNAEVIDIDEDITED